MEPYRSYFPNAGMLLPNTENLLGKVLTLPTGTSVSVEQVQKITALISRVVESGRSIGMRLRARSDRSDSYAESACEA
jgi:hypothetical protein